MMFPEQPSAQGAPDVANRNAIVGNMPGMASIMPILELLAKLIPQAGSAPSRGYTTSQQTGEAGRPQPLKQRVLSEY